jgi:hypothetical protein
MQTRTLKWEKESKREMRYPGGMTSITTKMEGKENNDCRQK